jgi:hypothetical protein
MPRSSVTDTKGMATVPVRPLRPASSVAFDGERLRIRDLSVDGSMAVLARDALAGGRDLELVVRQALEVGGAVLQHGAAKGTVDAVSAEVSRLLSVLSEKSARIEAVQYAHERGTAKGTRFELALAPALDACFSAHQDAVEVTSRTRGIADAIVGDFVVTVNPRDTGGRDRRIVVEAKNWSRSKLSLTKALAELDAGMLNRDAQVGIMVFADRAQAPLAGKPLRVFPGQRIILVWDPTDEASDLTLEICTQLARTLAIAAENEDLTLDRSILADRLAKLTNTIETASEIRRGISSARRGLDNAEAAYEKMAEDALALLCELGDRL